MITSDPMLLLPILAVGWKGFLLASLVQGIDRPVLPVSASVSSCLGKP